MYRVPFDTHEKSLDLCGFVPFDTHEKSLDLCGFERL